MSLEDEGQRIIDREFKAQDLRDKRVHELRMKRADGDWDIRIMCLVIGLVVGVPSGAILRCAAVSYADLKAIRR